MTISVISIWAEALRCHLLDPRTANLPRNTAGGYGADAAGQDAGCARTCYPPDFITGTMASETGKLGEAGTAYRRCRVLFITPDLQNGCPKMEMAVKVSGEMGCCPIVCHGSESVKRFAGNE